MSFNYMNMWFYHVRTGQSLAFYYSGVKFCSTGDSKSLVIFDAYRTSHSFSPCLHIRQSVSAQAVFAASEAYSIIFDFYGK